MDKDKNKKIADDFFNGMEEGEEFDFDFEEEGYEFEEGEYDEESYADEEGYEFEEEGYTNEEGYANEEGYEFEEGGYGEESYSNEEGYESEEESSYGKEDGYSEGIESYFGEIDKTEHTEVSLTEDISDMQDKEEYNKLEITDNFIDDNGNIVISDSGESKGFEMKYLDINSIGVPSRIRKDMNVDDITLSIKNTGLLKPLIVASTATEGVYVLLDGYRRLIACAKAGKRTVPCVVNKVITTTEIPVVEALYNHCKKYNIREIIDYIKYLEKEKGILNATMIEYLLELNSGDYTKIKDLLEDGDDEILSRLLNGQDTIEQAFKKLEKRRKEESKDAQTVKAAGKVYESKEENGAEQLENLGELGEEEGLTDEEIAELSIKVVDLDSEVEGSSLEKLVAEGDVGGYEPNKQDPNNRTRLDPAVRKAVLVRDGHECKVCKQIKGMEYTEVLDVHHIIEVYLGGNDAIDNLLTTCVVCHKLIHLWARGELHMRPSEEMTDVEKEKFKRVVELGNIIRKGMKEKGMKKEQLKKVDKAETIGRRLKGSSDQVAG